MGQLVPLRSGDSFQGACAQLVVPRVGGAGAVGELGPRARVADVRGVRAGVSSTAVREALARRRARRARGRGRVGGGDGGSSDGGGGGEGGDGSGGGGGNGDGSGDGEEDEDEEDEEEALNALHPAVLRYIDEHELFSSDA
jgi:hypothetical protein